MQGSGDIRRRYLATVVACALTCAAAACASTPPRPAGDAPPASIGVATMEADGTIVLQLRATAPGGLIGDGLVRYPPGDKDYDAVLKHLGGLRPGETKPVPPWPEPPEKNFQSSSLRR